MKPTAFPQPKNVSGSTLARAVIFGGCNAGWRRSHLSDAALDPGSWHSLEWRRNREREQIRIRRSKPKVAITGAPVHPVSDDRRASIDRASRGVRPENRPGLPVQGEHRGIGRGFIHRGAEHDAAGGADGSERYAALSVALRRSTAARAGRGGLPLDRAGRRIERGPGTTIDFGS